MLSVQDYQSLFHEIKNAICIIGSSLQLIEKQHPEVTSFSYWVDTRTDITNLRQLVCDCSSIKLNDTPNVQKEDIREFLSNLKSSTLPLFSERSLIRFDTAENLTYAYFDPLRMQHALLNLIKNASEAMEEEDSLTVRTYENENHLVFEIQDTGCGISDENLEKIFTPLFSSKKEGNGLGLSITKGIVESHNGTLAVSSVLGEGTTFTIQLPISSK